MGVDHRLKLPETVRVVQETSSAPSNVHHGLEDLGHDRVQRQEDVARLTRTVADAGRQQPNDLVSQAQTLGNEGAERLPHLQRNQEEAVTPNPVRTAPEDQIAPAVELLDLIPVVHAVGMC